MTVPNVTDAPAAPSQVLRVAIVDDDPFVLQALRAYLSSDERIEVTSTFSRAADDGRELGVDPATGHTIIVKDGRYGPYVTEVLPEAAEDGEEGAKKTKKA